ncbi:hypothetical protein QFC19_000439 [Naganishia cerealis]|uniref:Uncharacterized protein n=1 Tax=Naganishia cerealis TaxID=610337 RepID=A0ACC2WMB5_9TREE|nr:hypothetical protein QFC19_000439 [Naganishia cerealis]
MAAVNADDAVAITAEFFASLDNVQAEAAFLLEEIRSRDNAIMEHLRKAESRGNSLYRSVRQTGKDTPQADRINGTILNPATPKDAQNHSRVMQEYSKVEVLQEEKMALADTLTRIVTRHRERSRDEWRKIVGDEAVAAWDAAQEEELAHAKEPGGQMTLAAIAHQVANMTPTGSVGQLIGQLVQKGGLASGLSTPSGMDDRISKSKSSLKHVTDQDGAD